jgi:hypothetical protein
MFSLLDADAFDARIYPCINSARTGVFTAHRQLTQGIGSGLYASFAAGSTQTHIDRFLSFTPAECPDAAHSGWSWASFLGDSSEGGFYALSQCLNENNQAVILGNIGSNGVYRDTLVGVDFRANRIYTIVNAGDVIPNFGTVTEIRLGGGIGRLADYQVRVNPNTGQGTINSCGEIVFGLRTTDNHEGVFRWRMPHPADIDRNCHLNINDFVTFQQRYAAGDVCGANYSYETGAPALNINDFVAFQAAFAIGEYCSN